MSKAEKRALEAYPKDIEEYVDVNGLNTVVDNNSWQRAIFLKGYNQAEKDLELTWEDIQNISNIIAEMMIESYTRNSLWTTHEEFSKEVLKRFKAQKEAICLENLIK